MPPARPADPRLCTVPHWPGERALPSSPARHGRAKGLPDWMGLFDDRAVEQELLMPSWPRQVIGTSKPLLMRPSMRCFACGYFSKHRADDGNSVQPPRKSSQEKAASSLHLALAAAAQPAVGSWCRPRERRSMPEAYEEQMPSQRGAAKAARRAAWSL